MKSLVLPAVLLCVLPASAAIDLRVTEAWAGPTLTKDWFEITNLGSTAWTPSAGSIYYDDDSFAAASATVISGLTDIQPGESIIVVIGNSTDVTNFRNIWQPVISLTGVEIATNSGPNLSDNGDGVGIWLGGPSGPPTHQISFTASGASWDADVNATSTVGNASGAVANGAVIASPGRTTSGGATNPNAPVLTVSTGSQQVFNIPSENGGTTSGVINDTLDPAAQTGITFSLADANTPLGSLIFTATSSNATVVPPSNLVISGTGASRTLKIIPQNVGTATVTATLGDGALNDTYTITYAASAASSTPGESRYHTGTSDGSAAVPVGAGLMMVANDENEFLRLYDRAVSGRPLSETNLRPSLGIAEEADLEAAIRVGNRVYWIGSHGNSRTGGDKPTRRIAFSTDLAGSGAATIPAFVNKYTGLRTDLINWDNANGHGLGAGALGLAASAATPVLPTVANGFNIEGATLAPNGTTVLLGFRAPLQTTATRNRSLVIPALNLTSVINAGSGPASFGPPVFLDLGGRAIRSMDTSATGQVLILAGPVDNRVSGDAPNTFKFFLWDGVSTNPLPLVSTIDDIAANSLGSPESVFDLPATLVNGSPVGILVDNGSTDHYNTGQESKDLTPNWQKFRSETVTLTGIPLPIVTVTTAADSGPGSLRQAVASAPNNSTVIFDPALSGQTITLTSGQISFSLNLTVDASALPGGITVSGNGASRVFTVESGRSVSLKSLTIRNGNANNGGGIHTTGNLTVSGCTLTGNQAQNGGAIFSFTNLGGLKTTIVNSTITGNSATSIGGGIYNDFGRTELTHCTVTGNSAPSGSGAGVAAYGDNLTLTLCSHSIISGNSNTDVDLVVSGFNSFSSGGSNLIGSGDATSAFTATGDRTNLAPLLLPLGNYGGPTPTMPPRPDSPAIDWYSSTTATDQRGLARPVDGNSNGTAASDIGAVEFQPALVTNANDSASGSLRDAIGGTFTSTVTFSTAFFSGDLGDTILLSSEIQINRSLVIDASAISAGVVVSGNNTVRVFNVGASSVVTFDSLTITGGNSGSSPGGGMALDGGADVTISDSLIAENTTSGVGGGIMLWNGKLRLTNTTLAGNSASDGGALWCQGGGSNLKLTHATVSRNSSIYAIVSFINATLENSIVAGNTGFDFFESGVPVLLGQNLIGGNPQLAPLGNYGGPSRTMPPLPGSPAIEGALALATTPVIDQRRASRPSGPLPDLGAVEAVPLGVLSLASIDGDTIPDILEGPETSYPHLNPLVDNSGLDTDGDGSSDEQEIAGMTNPLDPNSIFRITLFEVVAINPSSTNIYLDFTSFPGLSYLAEASTDLDFSDARPILFGNVDTFLSQYALILVGGERFVRVRLAD